MARSLSIAELPETTRTLARYASKWLKSSYRVVVDWPSVATPAKILEMYLSPPFIPLDLVKALRDKKRVSSWNLGTGDLEYQYVRSVVLDLPKRREIFFAANPSLDQIVSFINMPWQISDAMYQWLEVDEDHFREPHTEKALRKIRRESVPQARYLSEIITENILECEKIALARAATLDDWIKIAEIQAPKRDGAWEHLRSSILGENLDSFLKFGPKWKEIARLPGLRPELQEAIRNTDSSILDLKVAIEDIEMRHKAATGWKLAEWELNLLQTLAQNAVIMNEDRLFAAPINVSVSNSSTRIPGEEALSEQPIVNEYLEASKEIPRLKLKSSILQNLRNSCRAIIERIGRKLRNNE